MSSIRVIVADDHTLVRQGVRRFLESADDIEVLAEASDGASAIALVEQLHPDVALLDIQMPGMNGVEALRQIKARFPEVRVLILTAHDDDPYVQAVLQVGADGYLLKTVDVDDLLQAVRLVHRGDSALSPEITNKLVRQTRVASPDATPVERLSAREIEILGLAAQGLTNKAIALGLHISDRTVQGHLANIYGKMGVASRTEAVTEALKRGWITLQ